MTRELVHAFLRDPFHYPLLESVEDGRDILRVFREENLPDWDALRYMSYQETTRFEGFASSPLNFVVGFGGTKFGQVLAQVLWPDNCLGVKFLTRSPCRFLSSSALCLYRPLCGNFRNGRPNVVRNMTAELTRLGLRLHEFEDVVGNFMPLPQRQMQWVSRMCGGYFDKYLFQLRQCLDRDADADPDLSFYVEQDGWFFRPYMGEGGFDRFVADFMLDGFRGDGGFSVFPPHMSRNDKTLPGYLAAVENFLRTSVSVIEARSAAIVERLTALA